jgi:hypothetical protein
MSTSFPPGLVVNERIRRIDGGGSVFSSKGRKPMLAQAGGSAGGSGLEVVAYAFAVVFFLVLVALFLRGQGR